MAKDYNDEEYLDNLLNSIVDDKESGDDIDKWFEDELKNIDDIDFDDEINALDDVVKAEDDAEDEVENETEYALEDDAEIINNNETIEENIDTIENNNKGIAEAGVMSIINAKTGKRIIVSREIMEKLNKPERVVMSFAVDKIAIGEQLPNNDNYINIKVLLKTFYCNKEYLN